MPPNTPPSHLSFALLVIVNLFFCSVGVSTKDKSNHMEI